MKGFVKVLVILLAVCEFCFAAATRRAEIYVDDYLYDDAEVLAAIEKYASAVEKNFNFVVDIRRSPRAFKYDKSQLKENKSPFKANTSAMYLKQDIKTSWLDASKLPLAGVILMGSLPYAQMEYFVRESDGKAGYPEDKGFLNYQRWVVDLYYMDLDGTWKDEIMGHGCSDGGSCDYLEWKSNGIYDAHYNKAGELGSDDFEIWVSRVNPYGEARESTEEGWQRQMEHYEDEYLPKVKELMLNWLDKAYKQQTKTGSRPDKALYTYSSTEDTEIQDYFVNPLLRIYNQVDIIHEVDADKYIEYIKGDYDWVDHMGHGEEKSFESGVSIDDFETPVKVKARVFDLNSCSIARWLAFNGSYYDRSVGMAHIFRTTEGGVSMIGSTKTSGGYQDNGYFYDLLETEFLGDAFVKWVNHRTLVFEESDYPKDVYEWFYEFALFGDPFVRLKTDKSKVKKDSIPPNIALTALHDFNISGKCIDKQNSGNQRCNAICGSTDYSYCAGIWDEAEIGDVYARGGVIARGETMNKIKMYNTFEDAEVSIKANVDYEHFAITNPARWSSNFLKYDTLAPIPDKPCVDVTVDGEYTLRDYQCVGTLTVNSKGTLIIPEGDFFVKKMVMKEGSKYTLLYPGYYAVMHVQEGFEWNATPTETNNDDWAKGFKVYVYGSSKEVDIYGNFYGTFQAPKTMLNIRGKAHGSYLGYSVAVHDVGTVWHVPFAPMYNAPIKKDTVVVHDTTTIQKTKVVHDTTVIHDTTTVQKTKVVHDTTTVQKTEIVRDTTILRDTTVIRDTTVLRDTIVVASVTDAPADGDTASEKISGETLASAAKITTFNRKHIAFEATENGLYRIDVMDLLGKSVATFAVNAQSGNNTVNWDASSLSHGRYIVSIKRNASVTTWNFTLR